MTEFSFQYPSWFILLCIAAAIFISGLLYFRSSQWTDRPIWHKILLAVLRFISAFLCLFLLLNPLIKSFKKEVRKPILVFAQDNSASLITKDSLWKQDYLVKRNQGLELLSTKYDIQKIEFGSQLKTNFTDQWNDQQTNLNLAFDEIVNTTNPENLKAVLLASDGIINTGKSPLYSALLKLAPVHCILLGDSLPEKDLSIQRVYYNDIIYSGDKFSIQVDVQAFHVENNKYSLSIAMQEDNGSWKNLQEFKEDINSPRYFTTKEIIIDALKPGLKHFRINASSINGERLLKNNNRDFILEVLDARKKVLIYALAPHPDIAAIREALLTNKNYDVTVKYNKEEVNQLESYTLVILHQMPGIGSSPTVLNKISSLKIPRIFILGNQSDLNLFNSIQDMLNITGNNKNSNEAQAVLKPSFAPFTTSPELSEALSKFPPLIVPFGNYKTGANTVTYLFQKVGKVETNYPLWVVSDDAGLKSAVICGEGLWKWRMNNFALTNSINQFSELISQSAQYAASKDDKRKFQVKLGKRIFDESESILFNAELYNDNFEKVNEEDVSLQLIKDKDIKYDFVFGRKDNYYEQSVGTLPPGDYSYHAEVTRAGKKMTADGRFLIQQSDIESSNLVADFNLLRNIAEKSNGLAVLKDNINALFEKLNQDDLAKPIIYHTQEVKPLLNWKLLFFLLFLSLGLEWFLRRYWGSY